MDISEVFLFAFNAIMPILLLTVLGYVLKRVGFLTPEFLRVGNRTVFYVCLPALLFINIYGLETVASIRVDAVVYGMIMIALFFVCGLLMSRIVSDKRQKGVIIQGAFRSNSALIGMTLSNALAGSPGVAVAASIAAFSGPVFNILAVVAMTMYMGEDGKKVSAKQLFRKSITNPMIIGVLLGVLCLVIRQFMPLNAAGEPVFLLKRDLTFVYTAIQDLAKTATPLALVVLGGQFTFEAVKKYRRQVIAATCMRLLIAPTLGLGGAILLSEVLGIVHFDAAVYAAYVAFFATPVAVATSVMASEMDNDTQLASQQIVWTSVLSLPTLFIFISILRGMGLL